MNIKELSLNFFRSIVLKEYKVYQSKKRQEVKEKVCNGILLSMALLCIPAVIASISRRFEIGLYPAMLVQLFLAIIIWISYILRNRLEYWFRASLIIAVMYTIVLTALLQFGPLAASSIWLVITPALAVILFNTRVGINLALFSIFSFGIIALLGVNRLLTFDLNTSAHATSIAAWLNHYFTYLSSGVMLLVAVIISIDSLLTTIQELEESKKKLDLVMSSLQEVVWGINLPDQKMEYISKSVTELYGYPIQYWYETPLLWQETIHPDDLKKFEKEIEVLTSKGTSSLKYRIITADKKIKWIITNVKVLKKPDGTLFFITGISRDITAAVLQEEKLQKIASSAKALQSAVDTGWSYIEFKTNGTIIKINDNYIHDTGYDCSKYLLGKHHQIFCDPNYVKSIEYKNFWKNLANGKKQVGEFKRIKKDGSEMWIYANYTPIRDNDGNIFKIIKISTDISEMVENRFKATSIAKELRQFIETANAPIFGIDNNGSINEWNETSEKITGFKKQEVFGKNLVQTYIDENHKTSIKKVLDDALKGEETANFEFPLFTKKGTRLMVLLNSTTRRGINGEIKGVLGVGQDITELVSYRTNLEGKVTERTKELNKALKKQKELNKLKSRFVSTASHEFRTPLSAISFAAGSIKKYGSKMEPIMIEKKLEKIEDQIVHMMALLNDVLIVGQGEAGAMRNNPIFLNLGNFICEIIQEVYNSCNKSHEIVLIDSEQLKSLSILIDEKLGRNIFINLIGNAVKFSPNANKVIIELSSEKDDIIIAVTDFGIGISTLELTDIFTPFTRGKNVDLIQGTGLGLSIVKEAVNVISGQIIVNSTLGKGTIFTVKIPKFN